VDTHGEVEINQIRQTIGPVNIPHRADQAHHRQKESLNTEWQEIRIY
jgi:hypothetical protein